MELSLALASLGFVLATYEWTVFLLRRLDGADLPTITEMVHKGHWPARILVALGGSFFLIDHFLTSWIV